MMTMTMTMTMMIMTRLEDYDGDSAGCVDAAVDDYAVAAAGDGADDDDDDGGDDDDGDGHEDATRNIMFRTKISGHAILTMLAKNATPASHVFVFKACKLKAPSRAAHKR